MQTGGIEGTDERHGALRDSERSRVDGVQLPGTVTVQNGGEREGPMDVYPKFWNLNPLAADKQEILRIPSWKGSFDLVKRELKMILEGEVLPSTVPVGMGQWWAELLVKIDSKERNMP